ncbi:MAG TPA: DUF2294 domain-containing protein [Symbiobacteriaceae bacterium]|nr:DUF2294 domain-containing protein [Symbiobacteriaceae bacterium]
MTKKGSLEKQIADAVTTFWRELLGRGPEDTRTFIVQDMIIVRMKGALTREERHLVGSDRGRRLVKQMRVLLREMHSGEVEALIAEKTGCQIVSSHSDLSTKTGERVEMYILDQNIEKLLTVEP